MFPEPLTSTTDAVLVGTDVLTALCQVSAPGDEHLSDVIGGETAVGADDAVPVRVAVSAPVPVVRMVSIRL